MYFFNSYSNRHTPIPQTLKEFASERSRADETYSERKLTPEELEEIYAKYGPPLMPLSERKRGFRRKGKSA
jgi:predicted  nucleic acid-binding Zn-ribbon protein